MFVKTNSEELVIAGGIGLTTNYTMGKFLRDSRNICPIKSFTIMSSKIGMTLNFSLYIGFCYFSTTTEKKSTKNT